MRATVSTSASSDGVVARAREEEEEWGGGFLPQEAPPPLFIAEATTPVTLPRRLREYPSDRGHAVRNRRVVRGGFSAEDPVAR